METTTIRIGKLPGKIVEIALENGSTIATALEIAELDHSGYEVRVNATPASLDTYLEDGDTVLLVKKVKGNNDFITVRIGKLPGRIEEVALNGNRTVAAALEASELDQTGYEIRVNATPADNATLLEDGDTVLLVKKVKGNYCP